MLFDRVFSSLEEMHAESTAGKQVAAVVYTIVLLELSVSE